MSDIIKTLENTFVENPNVLCGKNHRMFLTNLDSSSHHHMELLRNRVDLEDLNLQEEYNDSPFACCSHRVNQKVDKDGFIDIKRAFDGFHKIFLHLRPIEKVKLTLYSEHCIPKDPKLRECFFEGKNTGEKENWMYSESTCSKVVIKIKTITISGLENEGSFYDHPVAIPCMNRFKIKIEPCNNKFESTFDKKSNSCVNDKLNEPCDIVVIESVDYLDHIRKKIHESPKFLEPLTGPELKLATITECVDGCVGVIVE
jgi:hypothetical protein